jgi:hypothetical protein
LNILTTKIKGKNDKKNKQTKTKQNNNNSTEGSCGLAAAVLADPKQPGVTNLYRDYVHINIDSHDHHRSCFRIM